MIRKSNKKYVVCLSKAVFGSKLKLLCYITNYFFEDMPLFCCRKKRVKIGCALEDNTEDKQSEFKENAAKRENQTKINKKSKEKRKKQCKATEFLKIVTKKSPHKFLAWSLLSFTAFCFQTSLTIPFWSDFGAKSARLCLFLLFSAYLGRVLTLINYCRVYLRKVSGCRFQLAPLELFFASIAYPYCYAFSMGTLFDRSTKSSNYVERQSSSSINRKKPTCFLREATAMQLTVIISNAAGISLIFLKGMLYDQESLLGQPLSMATFLVTILDVMCGIPLAIYLQLLRHSSFQHAIKFARRTTFAGLWSKKLVAIEFFIGFWLLCDEISNYVWTFSLEFQGDELFSFPIDLKSEKGVFILSIFFIGLFNIVRIINLADYIRLYLTGHLGPLSLRRFYIFLLECLVVYANPLFKFTLLYHLKEPNVKRPQQQWRSITTLLEVILEDIPELGLAIYQTFFLSGHSLIGILSIILSATMLYIEGMHSCFRLIKKDNYREWGETKQLNIRNRFDDPVMVRLNLKVRAKGNEEHLIYYETHGFDPGEIVELGWATSTEAFEPVLGFTRDCSRKGKYGFGMQLEIPDSPSNPHTKSTIGVCLDYKKKEVSYSINGVQTNLFNKFRGEPDLYPACTLPSNRSLSFCVGGSVGQFACRPKVHNLISVLEALGYAKGTVFVFVEMQWFVHQWLPLPPGVSDDFKSSVVFGGGGRRRSVGFVLYLGEGAIWALQAAAVGWLTYDLRAALAGFAIGVDKLCGALVAVLVVAIKLVHFCLVFVDCCERMAPRTLVALPEEVLVCAPLLFDVILAVAVAWQFNEFVVSNSLHFVLLVAGVLRLWNLLLERGFLRLQKKRRREEAALRGFVQSHWLDQMGNRTNKSKKHR